jgi:hypothetical protein
MKGHVVAMKPALDTFEEVVDTLDAVFAERLEPVKPGIYKRGEVDYDQIRAVNYSTLKYLATSPKHYKHRVETPNDPTAAMQLGTAAHTAILEPHRYTTEYAVFTGERRAGKAWDAFCDANAGRMILKQGEFEAALRMRDAVRADPLAMRYLKRGDAEVTIVWRDPTTGILCKGRLDWLSTSVPDVYLEIKTARDVSPWAFQSAYARMQYHLQAAFYSDGYEQITGRTLYAKCAAVESSEPHDVVVYDVAEALDVGRDAYRLLLEQLAECRKTGVFPGIARGSEMVLRLPRWAAAEDEDLTGLGLEL